MAKAATPSPTLRAQLLAGEAVDESDEDPEVIAKRIALQILNAPDAETIFAGSGTTAAKDMLNVPLELRDVTLRNSDIVENGKKKGGVYALLDVTELENGEAMVLNTGSPRIMAQAVRAKELGLLPQKVRVEQVGLGKQGQSPPIGLVRL